MTFREQWLTEAIDELRPIFKTKARKSVPKKIHVSVGWPSGRCSAKSKTIAEIWSGEASRDGKCHIFISPEIFSADCVIFALTHEITHAVAGVHHQHKKPYQDIARAVGLVAPWVACEPSESLTEAAKGIAAKLGPYPHSPLTPTEAGSAQTTRMRLLHCRQCGCKVRSTRKWIEKYTAFPCPCGGSLYE